MGATGAAQQSDPGPVTYGDLRQTHEDYLGEQYGLIDRLYRGGFAMMAAAADHLTRLAQESSDRYAERCKTASYRPTFAQIVNQIACGLWRQPLVIKAAADADNPNTPGEEPDPEYYGEFAKNVDRNGLTFIGLLDRVLKTALMKRVGIVAVDAPEAPEAPASSLAEEDARGTRRLYAYELPVESLLDWKDGPLGMEWAVVYDVDTPRMSPYSRRDTTIETFTVWEMVDGFAQWTRFAIEHAKGRTPSNDELLTRVSGPTRTTFDRIPLLRLDLGYDLWIGNLIGPQALEHYNRRSNLITGENRSLCAIPYVKRGPEIPSQGGAIPSETQQQPDRGKDPVGTFNKRGYLELGSGDDVGFAEPDGKCFEIVEKDLDKLTDSMFAVTHQMAAGVGPTDAALGRSGLSKQKDQDSTEIVLVALGEKVKAFGCLVYTTISRARDEDVIWNGHGLDGYSKEDREQVLEEAVSMDAVKIPSQTFRRLHMREMARKLLPGIDPATLDQIYNEIDDGVTAEEALRVLQGTADDADDDNDADDAQQAPSSALAPPAVQPPRGTPSLTPPGGTPEPGGATADGKVGQSKAAKMAGTPSEAAAAPMANVAAAQQGGAQLGPGGQPLLGAGAHLQTGQHVAATDIYEMVQEDYRKADIQWILAVPWIGPREVPLASIDFSNKDRWQASQPEDADHVKKFVDKLKRGEQLKPVILVSNPSNDAKMLIVDGHHRGLAYLKMGMPVVAYIGQVGSDTGDWTLMHDSQRGSSNQKSSMQRSMQSPVRKSR
jgi:hypothetical protein